MSKNLMNFAVYLALGIICCVLLWRPWAPNEAAFGFKSADEEMRALLQRQTEERETASKAQGSGKETPAKTAPAKSASIKETQVKDEQSPSADPKGTAAPKGKINLNSATAEQLDALPGIGASRAQAIIALRQKLGGTFASVNQLLEVKGIGEKMLEKIAPLVTVEP